MENRVRKQVLIPLTLTFILLIISFLYTSYRIRIEDYASDLSGRYQHVQKVLGSLIADRINSMSSVIEFIAEQELFQGALQAKDRATLFKHGSAILERLHTRQQITHFYFYDRNGKLVLRVYQPENMSEPPTRFTKQQAMETGAPVSGLEVGSAGTFTLRIVYPWRIDNKLIGYIELGQEIGSILRELKTITEIDFLVFLDKRRLERGTWEGGMTMLGRAADWDLHPDKVLIDQTVAVPASSAARLIATDSAHDRYGSTVTVDGRTYRAGSFPLLDAAKHNVGDVVMLKDMTDKIRSFNLFVVLVVAFCLLFSGGLFVFSFRVLGRVDRRLQETQGRLRQELDNQSLTNQKLEVEISERRRAEESLTGLNEHLEQRVQDRTSELSKLNREIEAGRKALEIAYKDLQAKQATILQQDKMACIGQLAAGVAHDINNPIGFVTGNLEVLRSYGARILKFVKMQTGALSAGATAEQLARMEESRRALKVDQIHDDFEAVITEALEGADRVKRIVLNLKGFSRIDETGARLADIHECLESTIVIVGNELRHKAVVKKDYSELPPLYCHPQQLNQVFMNLLINASHAIDQWGTISIRTWADEAAVSISIGDTGCGISPENLPRIFEPFFTTKEAGIGTGLGLSIVRDIITKHGGEIAVESELKKGTVFTIRIPLRGPLSETGHA